MDVNLARASYGCSEQAGVTVYSIFPDFSVSLNGICPQASVAVICDRQAMMRCFNKPPPHPAVPVLCPSALAIGSLPHLKSGYDISFLLPFQTQCINLKDGRQIYLSPIPISQALTSCCWKLEIAYNVAFASRRCVEGPPTAMRDDEDENLSRDGYNNYYIAPTILILGTDGCEEPFLRRALLNTKHSTILVPMWSTSLVDFERAKLLRAHTLEQVSDVIRGACMSGQRIMMIADQPIETLIHFGRELSDLFNTLPAGYRRDLTFIDGLGCMTRVQGAYEASCSRVNALLPEKDHVPHQRLTSLNFEYAGADVLYRARNQNTFSCFLIVDAKIVREWMLAGQSLTNHENDVICLPPTVEVTNQNELESLVRLLGESGQTIVIDFQEAGKMGGRRLYPQFKLVIQEVVHSLAFSIPADLQQCRIEYLSGNECDTTDFKASTSEISGKQVYHSERANGFVLVGGDNLAEWSLVSPMDATKPPQSIMMTDMFNLKFLLSDSHTE